MSAVRTNLSKKSAKAAKNITRGTAPKPKLEVLTDVTFKTCSHCKVPKPLNAEMFARDRSSKDGFYGQCKGCEKEVRDNNNAPWARTR